MKKLSFIVFLTIQLSCSKSNNPIDIDQNSSDSLSSNKYEIMNILFDTNSTSVEEIKELKPNLTYQNTTGTVQKIIIDPQPIFETSFFNQKSDSVFTLVDSSTLYSVPQYVDNSQISLGEKKWKYEKNELKIPSNLNLKDSVYVQPNKNLKGSIAIIFNKITSEYVLTLRDIKTREIVKVNGIWTGFIPNRLECSMEFENL
ncbi:hypothetical protein BN1088_1432817 [Sphingobacterium sp. PM2-P1-29]|nr:hypothetical protein BN1088_1432817 [Sphingobacterium sp. PM2-P1-29]